MNRTEAVNWIKEKCGEGWIPLVGMIYENIPENVQVTSVYQKWGALMFDANPWSEDLEKIHGVGMKTSRCFILHSRKDAQYAGLDTHMLKFLRSKGIDAPMSTPSSKKQYLTLEKYVLYYAQLAKRSPADFDLEIWRQYSVKSEPQTKGFKNVKERKALRVQA